MNKTIILGHNLTGSNIYIYIDRYIHTYLSLFRCQMFSFQVGYVRQGWPPFLCLLWIFPKPCFMVSHGLTISLILIPHIWGIHIVEDGVNVLVFWHHTLMGFDKFIKAPWRSCLIFREINDWNPWFFNGFKKHKANPISKLEFFVTSSTPTYI